MNFANKRPYVASVSGGQAPTMMGTIFTEVLQVRKMKHQQCALLPHMNLRKDGIKTQHICEWPVQIPLENLGEVRQMHLHAVLRLIDAQIHVLKPAACSKLIVNCGNSLSKCSWCMELQTTHRRHFFKNLWTHCNSVSF
jgi:hypothetical protein